MKTNLIRIIIASLGISLIGCVLSNAIHAQTTISFDSSAENEMIMKIHDASFKDKPNMVILLFDSAAVTYDFSDDGEIALFTTSSSGGTSTTNFYLNAYNSVKVKKESKEFLEEQLIQKALLEEDEQEEEAPELEAWMLRPEEWMN